MFVKDLAVTINCEGCNCVVMVTNTCCVPQTMHRIKKVEMIKNDDESPTMLTYNILNAHI